MTQHTLKSNFETTLLPPKRFDPFDRSGAKDAPLTLKSEPALLPITGVHPAVIKIAMSAVVWFLAVAWLDFSGGPEVDLTLAVVTGFFVMFFTLFLLATSMVIDDPRWRQPKARFAEFLNDQIPVDRGTMRGRDVLIHILLLPVCLAAAATLIGLVWHLQS
jgi:hypothetical protein